MKKAIILCILLFVLPVKAAAVDYSAKRDISYFKNKTKSSHIEKTLYRIVDKQYPLPSNYIPDIAYFNKVPIHKYAFNDLKAMFDQADSENIPLVLQNSYRSYQTQVYLYQNTPNKSVIAFPGTSQHQMGLAFDFTSPEINYQVDINAGFENTAVYSFLLENAWRYGFVTPYILGHDGIYNEPWHYLYIGPELAEYYTNFHKENPNKDIFKILYEINGKKLTASST